MALKLYSTFTHKKQIFIPIHKGKVGMYSCGPTVYNYAHIGNLRTYLFNDILKRSLIFLGYKVVHVMNITDVDDKTIKGSVKENMDLKDFTQKYENVFFEDLEKLNIEKPTHTIKATDSISEMVKLIKELLKKGYAYKTDDGIYFSIAKSKNYGKLAQLDKVKQNKSKSRIKSDEYDKENSQDFALWKFYTKEDGNVFWNTDIGKGRPGWHIECSAMSMKILGSSFDIHTGAIDLIFPHHTNEIAQSEAATGKHFVKYWLHGGFLTMKEGKMSKSLGNIFYLKDLEIKGFNPLVYRYMCLTTHYRSPLLFSVENLESARNSYERLKNISSEIKDDKTINKTYLIQFKKAVEDDLDMPKALQILWNLIRDKKAKGKYQTINSMDEVLGLKLLEKEHLDIPIEIGLYIEQRENARKNKNWKLADELRAKIMELGYQVSDTDKGPIIKRL
jgi:cysteinyl-tRNA synthetase